MGDRETRIRVAWHMGAEKSPWDSVSWVKGFLPPQHTAWSRVSGGWNYVVLGLGCCCAKKRKGCMCM